MDGCAEETQNVLLFQLNFIVLEQFKINKQYLTLTFSKDPGAALWHNWTASWHKMFTFNNDDKKDYTF